MKKRIKKNKIKKQVKKKKEGLSWQFIPEWPDPGFGTRGRL